jgi:hypothetical protein
MATSVISGYFPITDAGEILVGARVFICDVGTTNLKSIYSDTALSIALDNPMDTDADGFHPQAYLSGSYKIRIETGGTDTIGSGTLIRQWDNIDGGVPVGSGDLPVADGGTGASTAAAARTNLSVPSQTELDDLSAELAELAGTVGSTGATQIATGTTAQRPADLADGQFRRNTTVPQWEGYDGTDWDAFLTDDYYATQAEMETATSATKVPTVSVLKNHPGVAKAWAQIQISGGTASILASHNVTSITDNGVGDITITFTTAFSSVNYCAIVQFYGIDASAQAGPAGNVKSQTASAARVQMLQATNSSNTTSIAADYSFMFAAFGDQ